MVACVACPSDQYHHSINTLKYADRAKEIKTHVVQNVRAQEHSRPEKNMQREHQLAHCRPSGLRGPPAPACLLLLGLHGALCARQGCQGSAPGLSPARPSQAQPGASRPPPQVGTVESHVVGYQAIIDGLQVRGAEPGAAAARLLANRPTELGVAMFCWTGSASASTAFALRVKGWPEGQMQQTGRQQEEAAHDWVAGCG
jgi:hypothetical protein